MDQLSCAGEAKRALTACARCLHCALHGSGCDMMIGSLSLGLGHGALPTAHSSLGMGSDPPKGLRQIPVQHSRVMN